MAIWAAYRYWLKEAEGDGEETSQALRFYQDYYSMKNTMRARTDNASGAEIRRWTIVDD